MRLEWKYTLLINASILVMMSIFFLLDDSAIKKETLRSTIRDYNTGTAMREIALYIQRRVESVSNKYDSRLLNKAISSIELQRTELEVVDINVTDAQGVVVTSLTGQAVNTQLDSDTMQRVISGQISVRYPTRGYYGHWVIEYTFPYIISFSIDSPNELPEIGAIQIIFSTQEILRYISGLRIRRLFHFGVVTIALIVFINPLTSHLIIRRLERLMETISAAQAGDLGARSSDASRDEIGRLGRSINRMIEQISLQHENRLKALGNLAAGVAHEVRNPLNSIAITIQYLRDVIDDKDYDEAYECLDVIMKQVKEINRIIEEFSQLSRPVEMSFKHTDINMLLSNILSDFSSVLEAKNIKLFESYHSGILVAMVDQDKLKQAISNIIVNAIQAMPNGGELHVSTSLSESRDNVIIEIRDTGVGISQQNLERLFEPYFTTKPDGIGLGLAITYRIIESHKGKITAISEEGQGAKFIINIPLEQIG